MEKRKKISTRTLTIAGMMVAITVILAYTPLGIIPLQPVSATTTHIPTIIVAMLEGPVLGAVVGLFFGLVSLFKALTQPAGILDPFFVNPLVSVVPRIVIGLGTGYFYAALKKGSKGKTLSVFVAGAIGSIINTIGSMGMLYVLYGGQLAEQMGTAAGPVIWGIITTYGLVEMLAAAVISTAVVRALQRIFYCTAIKTVNIQQR